MNVLLCNTRRNEDWRHLIKMYKNIVINNIFKELQLEDHGFKKGMCLPQH